MIDRAPNPRFTKGDVIDEKNESIIDHNIIFGWHIGVLSVGENANGQ